MNKWYPVCGYEGIYWINAGGSIRNSKGKILKVTDEFYVTLWKNGVRDTCDIRQLKFLSLKGNKNG